MPTLILLRGNSGSGKTTVAKELQSRFGRNTMLISQDVVRRDMLRVQDGPDTKALPLLIELLKYGSRTCEIVILEGILNAVWYRPLFETALQAFSSIHAYYYDLPFEETILRHQTKPNCHDFGEADMRKWWKEKDFLDILQETILTKEISFLQTVEIIEREVREEHRL